MIDAVVFDLDGLLVDSEPVWFRVRAEIFARFGLAWKEEYQKALMGKNTRAWIDDGVARLGGRLSPEAYKDEVLDGMVSAYRTGGVRLMPGAREAVAFCAASVPLGLASGSPPVLIDAALDANGWKTMFRETLSSDSVPRGKPAPDSYLEVLQRLKYPAFQVGCRRGFGERHPGGESRRGVRRRSAQSRLHARARGAAGRGHRSRITSPSAGSSYAFGSPAGRLIAPDCYEP